MIEDAISPAAAAAAAVIDAKMGKKKTQWQFAKDYGICPECSAVAKVMHSDFDLRGDVMACTSCSWQVRKTW